MQQPRDAQAAALLLLSRLATPSEPSSTAMAVCGEWARQSWGLQNSLFLTAAQAGRPFERPQVIVGWWAHSMSMAASCAWVSSGTAALTPLAWEAAASTAAVLTGRCLASLGVMAIRAAAKRLDTRACVGDPESSGAVLSDSWGMLSGDASQCSRA